MAANSGQGPIICAILQLNGTAAGAVQLVTPATVTGTQTQTLPDATGTVALLSGSQAWTGTQDFTGATALVATQSPGDSSTKAASTAFVSAAVTVANPMTTLGDTLYEDATPTPARLAGNTTTTKKYLSQTGNGTISAAPAWAQVAFADLSGSVAATQMPALTGDVTMTAGTTVTVLATTQPNAHTWSASQTFSAPIAILTAPSNDTALSIAGTLPSTATGQVGIASQAQPTSSATTSYMAIYYRAASAAAAYTQASTYGAYIDSPIKGAGSTMTTLYGLYIAAQSLGTTNYAIYTNAGLVRFGDCVAINSTPNIDTVLRMTGTMSSVAAGQVGLDLEVNPTSSATGSMMQLYTRNRSAAAAYTQSSAYSIYIDTPNYGAGSTVTTGKALFIDNQTGAGTNYAIHTKTGLVLIGDSTTSTSATTGALVVTGGVGIGGDVRVGGTVFAATKLNVGANSAGLTFSNSADVKVIDGAGNTTFRGVRATGWSDSVNACFFQIGNVGDFVAFTSQNGNPAARFQISATAIQLTSGNYLSIPPPTAGNLVEVLNGSGVLKASVNTSGFYLCQGTQVLANQQTGMGATLGAATAGGTYTATEQTMLQNVYNKMVSMETKLKTHGLIAT